MGSIVFGAIMPHPPIIVPQIGGQRLKEAEKTKRALQEISKRMKALDKQFDTIIVLTPHGEVGQAAVPVYTSHVFEGNFSYFGAQKPTYKFRGDPELGNMIVREGQKAGLNVAPIAESLLDHGVLVPLFYPMEAGIKKNILPIAIAFVSLSELYAFGAVIRTAAEKLRKRVVVIASADLSHRLATDAPGGFDPAGKKFDEELVRLVSEYDVKGILEFDKALAEKAGQDALWSIAMLLGALEGYNVEHEVLSYEGPFGVGYMVASFKISDK